MNKTELIAEVAKKCSLPKKDAEKAVNATFDAITEALCNGDKVQLVGFGGFETKSREAATPRPRKPLRSPPPPSPFSRPVSSSRTRSQNNPPLRPKVSRRTRPAGRAQRFYPQRRRNHAS